MEILPPTGQISRTCLVWDLTIRTWPPSPAIAARTMADLPGDSTADFPSDSVAFSRAPPSLETIFLLRNRKLPTRNLPPQMTRKSPTMRRLSARLAARGQRGESNQKLRAPPHRRVKKNNMFLCDAMAA